MQVYDCVAMCWHQLTPMPRPRASSSAVQWGNRILVAGGRFREIDALELRSLEWSTVCTSTISRHFCTALVFDDNLLLVGGLSEDESPCDTEQYNPETDSWSAVSGWGKFGSCLAITC